MRGIEVDADARTARVEAGVLGLELGEAAGAHGSARMPGSSPDVGVIGYTLGGGLSWLGAPHGFACNRVSAIELVTADGEPRTVDAENDADLFWALRGGGGGYAIVTALHTDLLPIAERLRAAPWSSRPSSAPTRSAPIATGPRRSPTRSPRSSASSARRRFPTCPSRFETRR